jgi:hypothetical protein
MLQPAENYNIVCFFGNYSAVFTAEKRRVVAMQGISQRFAWLFLPYSTGAYSIPFICTLNILPLGLTYICRPMHMHDYRRIIIKFPSLIECMKLVNIPVLENIDPPVQCGILNWRKSSRFRCSQQYFTVKNHSCFNNVMYQIYMYSTVCNTLRIIFISKVLIVRYSHGGGWSRKINAWHLHTLMVYL